MLTPLELKWIIRMKRHGILIPRIALGEVKRGQDFRFEPGGKWVLRPDKLALMCALLMQESGGGQNEFGHDPTVAIGWGVVTKAKYQAYLHLRDYPRHGARCQGVGPVQLTYYGYQDEADRMGGCWNPTYNVRVGWQALTSSIGQHGWFNGIAAYNGSGSAAQHYSISVNSLFKHFQKVLAGTA